MSTFQHTELYFVDTLTGYYPEKAPTTGSVVLLGQAPVFSSNLKCMLLRALWNPLSLTGFGFSTNWGSYIVVLSNICLAVRCVITPNLMCGIAIDYVSIQAGTDQSLGMAWFGTDSTKHPQILKLRLTDHRWAASFSGPGLGYRTLLDKA